MPRLTKTVVDSAPLKELPYFIWCSDLHGFGVRIWPVGKKSFYADYRNAAGARKRMAIGTHGVITCEQARKLATATLGAVVRGGDPAQDRTTARKSISVSKLCDQYLDAAGRGLIIGKRGQPKKISTLSTDRGRIERHIKPLLGGKRVRDLTQADINRFIRDVSSGATAVVEKTANLRGKAIVEGGLGTAARTAGLLGGILSFAVSEGIRPDNPCRGVRRPAGQRRKRRLTADEYAALGKALAADGAPWQFTTAARLLALTGARLGEIVNLKWAEVDHEQHCLRLHDSKEGASTRPLGQPALAILDGLERTGGFVFPAVRRGHGAFGGMARGWQRLTAKDGLPGVLLHTLRHSFASVADDCGFTRPTISALLGHSTGGTTEHYIHKTDPVLIAAADRVAGTISQWMPSPRDEDRRAVREFATRPGRPGEPDDQYLTAMRKLCSENPGLPYSEAARRVVLLHMPPQHSQAAAIERLRKKFRPMVENRKLIGRWPDDLDDDE